MDNLRRLKGLTVFGLVMLFFFSQSLIATLVIRGIDERRRYFVRITKTWARRISGILRLDVEYILESDSIPLEDGYLVTSNHLSYTDLFVLVQKIPGIFITSNEIRETPLLGYIARRSGCIFVERRKSKRSAEGRTQELANIARVCAKKHNVVVFPEATSTDGQTVIPFKAGMFEAVIDHDLKILPVTIKYVSIDGDTQRENWSDNICWYGDMTFLPHLLNLFTYKKIKVEVTIGTPIAAQPGATRESMAALAHTKVLQQYV